jgi:signal transduction histidine kinase
MEVNQEARTDVWQKWDWFWQAIFYASVVFSTGLMLSDDTRTTSVGSALLLTALLVVWHWGGLRLANQVGGGWEEGRLYRFVVIIGDIVLWFILVNTTPAYYFVLFGLFGQVFRHLPIRYAVTATLLLTAAIIYEQLADAGDSFSLSNPIIWVYVTMALAGIILGVWISAIISQSSQRRELIEQLETAQAELAAAERREGVLEERQRLSREIHDTLAQGFTSIVMHLEAAEQALPGDPDVLQKHLNRARATARTSLEQARRVVEDLRPDLFEKHSLPDAIERTAARWREETDISLTTTTTGTPVSLHPNIEVTLLRVVQEALANVRKHARASAVQITLSYMADIVVLDVQDDGVGLDGSPSSSFSGGYGLQAMRERVNLCGGSVTLESEVGEGTTVAISIPISA